MKNCINFYCPENNPQPISNFYFNKGTEKYLNQCKTCKKKYNKTRYKNNKDKVKKSVKEYENKNQEKVKVNRKIYYNKNRDKILKQKHDAVPKDRKRRRTYEQTRYHNDPQFKLKDRIRGRLRSALKGKQKIGSAVDDLGCLVEYAVKYIESKFKPNPKTGKKMTWNNCVLDHIIPLCIFDLTNPEQFKIACHYKNLQPLWFKENAQKGNKIIDRQMCLNILKDICKTLKIKLNYSLALKIYLQ